MKKIFWILVLLNVVVFAYFERNALSPAVSSLKPELQPQQIKILTEQSLLSYPTRHPEAAVNEPSDSVVQPADSHVPASEPVSKPDAQGAEAKLPETKPSEQKSPEPNKPVSSNVVEARPAEAKQAEKAPSAKPAEQHAATAGACYEWSSFNTARLNEALSLAQQLNIKTHTNLIGSPQDNVRYWIYKPPLPTAEAAQIKADELRKLGVEDFFVVQDDPKWRNAISFGVFRDEKLADKLMLDLKNKGVKLLIKATRNGGQAVIKMQQVSPQQLAGLQKARSQFPDAVLKEIPCN
ncbi:SPOR domain-containing protein [Methylophilus sp. 13]|uniref:SPOR domain-containing protein n=1 Tax=Methylophilus sp. 13 TaxID=2781018 RepID=UPI0018909E5E|nr:SPOR domain-containing protein [Methylophilus sp. 13]MBF5038352.1 SPOR domain-containing protein [Methylophilus sp. 13]